ncbi:MAG TPA: efflux RND transporter periplasmic adaptor subunit [Gemmatimonadales bacterium]|jgi:RND family efflux transporter MFP subunit|nr:efflux RND transporter periplasmic adaptor subunit [Gemmatimonadales bacterium]
MKGHWLWALGSGLTALLPSAACKRSGGEEAELIPRVPVATTVIATDTITDVVTVVGRLTATPGGSALLTAPAPAVVRRVHAQLGARVTRGTLLLELDAPELVTSARTLAAQAELAERDAARQRELFRQGITSQRQADEKAAEATGARAAANAAAVLLARARVTSPIAGAVQRVEVHPGERVDAGKELIEVINSATLDLLAQVPAADLAHLKVGAVALVLSEGVATGAPGKVAALAPAVDSLTNAGQAVVRVPNPLGALRPGAAATARIVTGAERQALIVPDSALVVVGDSLSVFVVSADSVAHARPVGVGIRRGGRAEILRGLSPGERVVSSGAFGLSDGMKVIPAQPAKP